MGDPTELVAQIEAAEDAFSHAHGQPTFEPGLNASPDADPGEVQIGKACRLLKLIREIDAVGEYYGAVLEHSFIVVEQTLQGYLIAVTDVDANELRNHDTPYDLAKGRVPLEDSTIDSLKALYDAGRTEHYYGTTVTTAQQAETMRSVAEHVHDHVVTFDHDIEQFCRCPGRQ